MVTVEQLKKSFKDIKAVDDLSFKVNPGEIVGLLGPNGAGKTTTMRLMAGFLFPDSGTIKVGNISVATHPTEAQRYIGYLPENNPLYKDMLVSETLNLSADLKGIPKIHKKSALDFAVSAVSIEDIFYRPIGELSKGYRQRVGMAIAMLHQPPILIMDEPTEGLDPNQRAEIRALIKELAKNRTIILSTHVMQEAQAVCSRLLIINKGRLIADGTPESLSKASSRETILTLELEGLGVPTVLRSLEGVRTAVNVNEISENRFSVRIATDESIELRPEISKLIRQNNWIIWKLAEEERKLEDVFYKLTAEV